MIYASRLLLEQQTLVQNFPLTPYQMHQFLSELFPPKGKGGSTEARGFVYKERQLSRQRKEVLVFSQAPPRPPEKVALETKPIPKEFLLQTYYRFEIKVNAVKREFQKHKTGPLRPILEKTEMEDWFKRKALHHGFRVEQMEILQTGSEVFFKNQKHSGPITQYYALISGLLEVQDRNVFQKTFQNGFGRGKAFGFGLLEILPLASNPQEDL